MSETEQEQQEQKPERHTRAAKTEERTYDLSRLSRESHELLGVEPHVIAGAFYGQKEKKDGYSLAEAKARVEEWLSGEVETDPNKQLPAAAGTREEPQ